MTKLIDQAGQPLYGWIKKPISEVNFLDYPLENTMDVKLSPWKKRLKFNQFHFIGLLGDDFMAGIAIVNLKLVSTCFFYVWDKDSGLIVEESQLSPLALGTRMGTSPDACSSRFAFRSTQAEITQTTSTTQLQLASREVSANIQLKQESGFEPLRICSQAGYNGWAYTQKATGLTVTGELRVGNQSFDLSTMNVLGNADWSCGFMRRETAWNWGCFSGKAQSGKTLGLNLASGVNETGVTENAFWLDGRLHKLGPVRFHFNRSAPENPWLVMSDCGRVKLVFTPEGKRTEKINIGVLASNFKQMFGFYSGTLITDQGETISFTHIAGFAEDHYAKW